MCGCRENQVGLSTMIESNMEGLGLIVSWMYVVEYDWDTRRGGERIDGARGGGDQA